MKLRHINYGDTDPFTSFATYELGRKVRVPDDEIWAITSRPNKSFVLHVGLLPASERINEAAVPAGFDVVRMYHDKYDRGVLVCKALGSTFTYLHYPDALIGRDNVPRMMALAQMEALRGKGVKCFWEDGKNDSYMSSQGHKKKFCGMIQQDWEIGLTYGWVISYAVEPTVMDAVIHKNTKKFMNKKFDKFEEVVGGLRDESSGLRTNTTVSIVKKFAERVGFDYEESDLTASEDAEVDFISGEMQKSTWKVGAKHWEIPNAV